MRRHCILEVEPLARTVENATVILLDFSHRNFLSCDFQRPSVVDLSGKDIWLCDRSVLAVLQPLRHLWVVIVWPLYFQWLGYRRVRSIPLTQLSIFTTWIRGDRERWKWSISILFSQIWLRQVSTEVDLILIRLPPLDWFTIWAEVIHEIAELITTLKLVLLKIIVHQLSSVWPYRSLFQFLKRHRCSNITINVRALVQMVSWRLNLVQYRVVLVPECRLWTRGDRVVVDNWSDMI